MICLDLEMFTSMPASEGLTLLLLGPFLSKVELLTPALLLSPSKSFATLSTLLVVTPDEDASSSSLSLK